MISTDFFQTLGETSSKLLPVGGLILAVVVVSYIRHRTRSGHPILRWIWSKLTGKADSKDAEFDKFMDGQDNLMQFRFVVGNARTLHQMHGIIRWAQTYDEDVGQAFACGPYFDLERPGLKPIHRSRTNLAALGVTLFASGLLLTTLALAAIGFSGGAVVNINQTDTTLLLQKSSARLIFDTRRLERQDCTINRWQRRSPA